MKKLFKRLVLKVTFLSDLILDKGIGTKVRLATLAGNFIVNFLFRQNISYSVCTNFKSTVIAGEKLISPM